VSLAAPLAGGHGCGYGRAVMPTSQAGIRRSLFTVVRMSDGDAGNFATPGY